MDAYTAHGAADEQAGAVGLQVGRQQLDLRRLLSGGGEAGLGNQGLGPLTSRRTHQRTRGVAVRTFSLGGDRQKEIKSKIKDK